MATEAGVPVSSRPPLPPIFNQSSSPPLLQFQGAEALLYRTSFIDRDAALKHRPSKPYRHPTLDAKLTRHRILSEARVLVKLRRDGVSVPAVYALDWEDGWMISEWIEGRTVRSVLDERLPGYVGEEEGAEQARTEENAEDLVALMARIGRSIALMHQSGVVHGDLTTSNLMLRSTDATGEIVIIDFGLAEQSVQIEDRGVDLYVLERAFGSTHPRTESLFAEVLRAYGGSYKGANQVIKRYEEVRLRGRKKIMIG